MQLTTRFKQVINNNSNNYHFEAKMKYSRQRELILKSLRENCIHPTAEQLYDFIHQEEPTVSLATVYRNLNLLAENGMVKKIEGLDGTAHFDHQTHDHYHFICTRCGQVFDVPYDIAPDLETAVEKQTGLKVTSYDIAFRGICQNCRKIN